MNIFFSVIVPIYGVEKYIEQCIDSVLMQTYKSFEMILVDDGSKDRCPEICDEYAQKDPRIRVVHKKNGGLVSARKAGLAVAKGDYIINVDGDDWVVPDMLLTIAQSIMDCGILPEVVCFDYYKASKGKNVVCHQKMSSGLYNHEERLATLKRTMMYNLDERTLWDVFPSICFKAVKREFLFSYQNKIPDNIPYGEDAAVVYTMLSDAKSILVINDSLYYYRTNMESMCNKYDEKLYEKTSRLFEFLKDNLKDQVLEEQLPYYAYIMIANMFKNEVKNEKNFCSLTDFIVRVYNDESNLKFIHAVKIANLPMKHAGVVFLLRTHRYKVLSFLLLMLGKLNELRG